MPQLCWLVSSSSLLDLERIAKALSFKTAQSKSSPTWLLYTCCRAHSSMYCYFTWIAFWQEWLGHPYNTRPTKRACTGDGFVLVYLFHCAFIYRHLCSGNSFGRDRKIIEKGSEIRTTSPPYITIRRVLARARGRPSSAELALFFRWGNLVTRTLKLESSF